MARTLTEIQASLDASITGAITTPSGSQFAEWRLWRSIFATALWAFENIMDAFRVEIESKIQTKQPGTFAWYYDRVLEFQGGDESGTFQGDSLDVSDGIINYNPIDETRRIITRASIRADSGTVNVKVAKNLTETSYQPLTAAEILAFEIYLDNIKYPGTDITVISQAADKIRFDLDIIYDPIISQAAVQDNINAKLEEYRNSLGFDDRIFKQKLVEAIMEAEGVVSVKVNSMDGYGSGTAAWTAIDIVRTLEAGYFNYETASLVYDYINVNTL